MFETIVVGTNWSETAEIALVKALELARLHDARLHVVAAHQPGPAPVARGGTARGAGATGADFQADVVLDRTLDRLGAEGVAVEQHTAAAEPADAILAVAEQVRADLIIVGNKGMHRRLLGSIPNKVSHQARCDVLIVRTT
jgi:nucleotide-binding universal stress UspA family protein